jgi:hypothetical protein
VSPPGTLVTEIHSALAEALRERYVIERQIGRGGMATVYLARDLKHDRQARPASRSVRLSPPPPCAVCLQLVARVHLGSAESYTGRSAPHELPHTRLGGSGSGGCDLSRG